MKNWYKEIEPEFLEFPPEMQILHLVSDLKKAEHLSSSSPESSKNHLYRAIILLDYIVSDPKWRGKLRELLRLREVIESLIFGTPYGTCQAVIKAALLMEPLAYRKLRPSKK